MSNRGLVELGGAIVHTYVIEAAYERITSPDDIDQVPAYWSNEFGWVPFYAADRFDHSEAVEMNLPLDGIWVSCISSTNCTAVDSSYVLTEVVSLLQDPDLEVGKPSEIDPT